MVQFNFSNNTTSNNANVVIVNNAKFNINDVDTEKLFGILAGMGYVPTENNASTVSATTTEPKKREAVTVFTKPWVANWSVDFVDKTTGKKSHKQLEANGSLAGTKFYVLAHSYVLKNQKPLVKACLAKCPNAVGFNTTFTNEHGHKVSYDTFGFSKLADATNAVKWLNENYPVLTVEQLNNQSL